jgi:hypothetical protein
MAAAVAAATAGLVSVLHIPKVLMFTPNDASSMIAATLPSIIFVGALVAIRLSGDVPKGHMIVAPVTTAILIVS